VAIWAKGVVLLLAGAVQTPGVHKGLEITVKGLERATNVSLQDCPPGENIVRGVIRPVENNEFVTVRIDVKVLPSFAPVSLAKPVLFDAADKSYKTAQSFGEMSASASYSCAFSFRVPKGTKVSRFTIEEASFDVSAFDK
jgi:hypothetical protein